MIPRLVCASGCPEDYTHTCLPHTDNAWHHVAASKPLQSAGNSETLTDAGMMCPSQSDPSYCTKLAPAPLQSASSHDGSVMTAGTGFFDGLGGEEHGDLDDMQAHDDFLLDNLHDMLASGQGVFSDVSSVGVVLDMPSDGQHGHEIWMEDKLDARQPTGIAVGMPVWDTVQGAPALPCP